MFNLDHGEILFQHPLSAFDPSHWDRGSEFRQIDSTHDYPLRSYLPHYAE